MTEPLDQIGAAIPGLRLCRVGLKRAGVEIESVPRAETRPNVEREHQAVWPGRDARRRDRIEKCPDRKHVVARDLGEPLIGERGVEILPVSADTVVHRTIELIVAPGADAVGRVRRDVGRIERPIRRTERRASCVGRAAGGRVTGFAVAGPREIGAPFDERGIRRVRRVRRSGTCNRRAYHQDCRGGAGFDPLHRILPTRLGGVTTSVNASGRIRAAVNASVRLGFR